MASRTRSIDRASSCSNCSRMTSSSRCSSSSALAWKSRFAWRFLFGRTNSPRPARRLAARMPVTSTATVLAAATTSAPSPTAPASATATVATAFRTDWANSFASASRSYRSTSSCVRLAADLADEPFFVLSQSPPVDIVSDALPYLQILIDHPVDQLVHDRIDLPLGTSHDLPLELAPDLVFVQQIEDASQADRLLEKGIPTLQ